jgi:hypothetical protein
MYNLLAGYHWSVWKILVVSVAFFILLKIVIGFLLLRRCLRQDKNREIHLGKGDQLHFYSTSSTLNNCQMLVG